MPGTNQAQEKGQKGPDKKDRNPETCWSD